MIIRPATNGRWARFRCWLTMHQWQRYHVGVDIDDLAGRRCTRCGEEREPTSAEYYHEDYHGPRGRWG